MLCWFLPYNSMNRLLSVHLSHPSLLPLPHTPLTLLGHHKAQG